MLGTAMDQHLAQAGGKTKRAQSRAPSCPSPVSHGSACTASASPGITREKPAHPFLRVQIAQKTELGGRQEETGSVGDIFTQGGQALLWQIEVSEHSRAGTCRLTPPNRAVASPHRGWVTHRWPWSRGRGWRDAREPCLAALPALGGFPAQWAPPVPARTLQGLKT